MQAYTNRMYGPKYQWIILGGYSDKWWAVDDPNVSCSAAELNHTIHGYISTDVLPISSSKKKTESGLVNPVIIKNTFTLLLRLNRCVQ